MHFDKPSLESLESIYPLEEVFTAEVAELRLVILLRLSDDLRITVFEAVLKGRCEPKQTVWRIERAVQGEVGTGRGEAREAVACVCGRAVFLD